MVGGGVSLAILLCFGSVEPPAKERCLFITVVGGVSLAMMSWLCAKFCMAVPVCHESLKEFVAMYPV